MLSKESDRAGVEPGTAARIERGVVQAFTDRQEFLESLVGEIDTIAPTSPQGTEEFGRAIRGGLSDILRTLDGGEDSTIAETSEASLIEVLEPVLRGYALAGLPISLRRGNMSVVFFFPTEFDELWVRTEELGGSQVVNLALVSTHTPSLP